MIGVAPGLARGAGAGRRRDGRRPGPTSPSPPRVGRPKPRRPARPWSCSRATGPAPPARFAGPVSPFAATGRSRRSSAPSCCCHSAAAPPRATPCDSASPGRPARAGRRGALYARLLSAGAAPPSRALVTVGLRDPGPPAWWPRRRFWGLTRPATGSSRSGATTCARAAPSTSLRPAGRRRLGSSSSGAWRPPADRFDRETRGLEIAAQIGAVAAGHAPRPLGRFEVDGLPASLETAAVGDPLDAHLAGAATPRRQARDNRVNRGLASHRRHGVGPHRAARGRAALPGA